MGSYVGIVDGNDGSQQLVIRNASISRRARIDGDAFLQNGATRRLRLGVLQGISQYQEELLDTDTSQSTIAQWTDFNGNLGVSSGGFDAVSDEQVTPVIRNGVWKIEVGTGGSVNATIINNLLTDPGFYRVRITYYIPTTNAQVASFRFAIQGGGTTTFFFRGDGIPGSWNTLEATAYTDSTSPIIVLTNSVDSSLSVTAGDVIYIADVQIHKFANLLTSVTTNRAITDSPVYEADWSAGSDSWSKDSGNTVTGNNDGVTDDNAVSYDNCFKLEVDAGTANQHRMWKIYTVTAGVRYRLNFRVLIPSSNTRIDGFLLQELGLFNLIEHGAFRSVTSGFQAPIGEWTAFELDYTAAVGAIGILINPYDGFTDSWEKGSGDSDVFYMSEFKVTPVDNFPVTLWETSGTGSSDNSAIEHFSGNASATDGSGRTETNCLKYSAGPKNSQHNFKFSGVMEINNAYRLMLRLYIPTSNTHVDGLDIETVGGTGATDTRIMRQKIPAATNWFTTVIDFRATGEDLNFVVLDGTAETFTGTRGEDDLIYFKEIALYDLQHMELFYPSGFPEATDYAFIDEDGGIGTMQGGYDAVSDGSSSNDNCFRIDISGAGTHRLKMSGVTVGLEYRVMLKVYVPSTNTHCDGLEIHDASGAVIASDQTASSSWHNIEATFTPASDTFIRIVPMDGASSTFTPTTTDFLYFQILEVVPNRPEVYSGSAVREFEVGIGTSGSLAGTDSSINNGVMLGTTLPTDESGAPKIGPTFYYDGDHKNPCWTMARYKTRNDTADIDQMSARVIVGGAESKNVSSTVTGSYDSNLTFGVYGDSQLSIMPTFLTFVGGDSPSDSLAVYGHYLHATEADSSGTQMSYTVSDFDTDMQEVDDSEWGQVVMSLGTSYTIPSAIGTSDGNLNTFTLNWPSETHELTISKLGGIVAPSA